MAALLGARLHTEMEIRESGRSGAARFVAYLWRHILRFTVGTGVRMRDRGVNLRFVIPAGDTETIDLTSIADYNSVNVAIAKVTEIRILNFSPTLELQVGPTSGGVGFGVGGVWMNDADARQVVGVAIDDQEPGEYICRKPAGMAVVAATGDRFDITAAAGDGEAIVIVQLLGKSA